MNENNHPLIQAIKNDQVHNLQLLIDMGHDYQVVFYENNNLLHYAAGQNSFQCLKFLVKKGLFIDSPNIFGVTPLHTAVYYHSMEAVKTCLDLGADINRQNTSAGLSALHVATKKKSVMMINYLIKHHAIPDIKDAEGRTPLFHAVMMGYKSSAEELINNGASINIADKQGETPLFNIICRPLIDYPQCLEMLEFLLERGADPDIINSEGFTPLMYAGMKKHKEMVKLLKKHGAETDWRNIAHKKKNCNGIVNSKTNNANSEK